MLQVVMVFLEEKINNNMKKQPMKKMAPKAIKPIATKGDSTKLKSVAVPKGKAPGPSKVRPTKEWLKDSSLGLGILGTMGTAGMVISKIQKDNLKNK